MGCIWKYSVLMLNTELQVHVHAIEQGFSRKGHKDRLFCVSKACHTIRKKKIEK